MEIGLGNDHGGWKLRGPLAALLESLGHHTREFAGHPLDADDDYPDVARELGRAVRRGEIARGILVCGSGIGASIAVNKVRGVRGALCHDTFSAHQGVEDDDANVLVLGARVVGESLAMDIAKAFLSASFSGAARHRRRLEKLSRLEADFARSDVG